MANIQLPERVQNLIEKIKEQPSFTPRLARQLLEASGITKEDLMPWADFNHPDADSYGRKLVYDGEYFELMVMSWVDGDMSSIHDHGYAEWGAVKLFGPAEHAVFKNKDGKLTTLSRCECEDGTVLAVDHDMIHQMGNVGKEPYLTLHLYGSYNFEEGVTADARLYDLEEGKIQFTNGGVFFELPEDKVKRREECPSGDFPTWLRCNTELMKRLLRMNGTLAAGAFQNEREKGIAQKLFDGQTWDMLSEELDTLDTMNSKQAENYHEILDQELFMAAKLQTQLLDANLIDGDYSDYNAALKALLPMGATKAFTQAFMDLLPAHFETSISIS